ncbi:MAG: MATE family efflux transporter [Planctomycetota bacterium]|nr:MAG: MATE family efflux transporter [Planctomycetota bacterium]
MPRARSRAAAAARARARARALTPLAEDGAGPPAAERAGVGAERRALLALAWPAVLSFLLTNSWRFIDHYWVRGLGLEAQAAVSACFFVSVMNYALHFLAAGGALPLVSQALGARREERAAELARHALVLAAGIGLVQTVLGPLLAPHIVEWLGMRGETAAQGVQFTRAMYAVSLSLALAPVIDFLFLARGDTRTPLVLQALAAALNWVLNPLLIFGAGEFEGFGVAGAAWATGIARAASVLLGLLLLARRTRGAWMPRRRVLLEPLEQLVRVALPNALSIAVYSAVYWGLQGLVLAELGDAVRAGLGVGFQVFEGLSYPCYVGISLAAAAQIGRAIGERDPALAWRIVRAGRQLAWIAGGFWTLVFLAAAPLVAPHFASDAAALRETLRYTSIVAFSQVCVAAEAVNERVLLGAGRTRAIFWIASAGNLLRLPLCWWVALPLGGGPAGMYWVLNATSALKALTYRWLVQRRRWLEPRE